MPGILQPSMDDGQMGPAGWGNVPTIGGSISTAIPDPTTGTSTVQVVQSNSAATQSAAQSIFLPPAPTWSPLLDESGAMNSAWVTWFQTLNRKLGGYNSSFTDDAVMMSEDQASADSTARYAIADLQVQDNTQARVSDLQSQLDGLAQLVFGMSQQGWTRQGSQIAATASAPAGGTGTAAGAWDTSGNRDTAIAFINNVGSRLASLETKLRTIGVIQ